MKDVGENLFPEDDIFKEEQTMRKRIRGKVAGILAAILLGTTIVPGNVFAEDVASGAVLDAVPDVQDSDGASGTEIEEIQDKGEENDIPEQPVQDNSSSDENTVSPQQNDEEVPEREQEDPVVASQGLVNYVGVLEPYIQAPGEQQIVLSYGDGTENVSDAKVICENADGSTIELGLDVKENEVYLFRHTFEESEAGVYRLARFTYVQDGVEASIELPEIGIEALFGVNEDYTGGQAVVAEEAGISTEELEASVVTVDLNAVEDVESDIEEAIEETVEIIESEESTSKKSSNKVSRAKDTVLSSIADVLMPATTAKAAENVVVVLDPGHGGSDSGASANGLIEKNLNLSVALACKKELEEYNGVTVYMTRSTDVYVGLQERANKAKAWGADIFVSLHMNSASSGANGVEVYYPNSNYNPTVHEEGRKLAAQIQQQLVSLGLGNRNIKEDPSSVNQPYPDGSRVDGYQVIRYNKLNGIPGIIVEHAFLTNSSDAAKLKDPNFVNSLGIADATGIANYFNLSKGLSVKIENKDDFDGTAQINVKGVGRNAKVKVTNESSNKTKEYSVQDKAVLEFNINDFDKKRGKYTVEVFNASSQSIFKDTFTVSEDVSSEISIESDSAEKQFKVNVKFKDMPAEVKEVKVPVWCDKDQKDLIWYNAKQVSKGNWQATINIKDHKLAGKYQVHTYAVLTSGKQKILGGKSFEVSQPTLSVKTDNYQSKAGTFDVIIADIESKSGVSKVQVPVWCATDQSDIKWYDAVKQDNGNYKVTVNMSNHKYATGLYKVHVYLTSGNGITAFGSAKNVNVTIPDMEISVVDTKKTETLYALKVTNPGVLGVIKGVQFATWSVEGDQDDLKWYNASKNSDGSWGVTADIKNHKTAGKYNVHVYATLSDGKMKFLGATSFEVSKPTLTVRSENYQEKTGTFDVIITDIESKSGVGKIQVPVWCAADQNDIKWYDAVRQDNGDYKVTVSMSNHKYATGLYKIHTYMTAGNGVTGFGSAKSVNVIIPNMEISAIDAKKTEITYALKVTNPGLFGIIKGVQFATWSIEGGQDDLIWYGGSKNADGSWSTTADIRKHKTAGKYNVHVYATLTDGNMRFLGATSFEVSKPTLSVRSENYQENAGTFDVIVSDINSKSGVDKIQVPVWCAADQNDIKWYNAVRQGNGDYKVTVNMSNHKYATGLYKIHTYMTSGNGVTGFGAAKNVNVIVPNMEVTAVDTKKTETTYALKVTNPGLLGVIKGVQFATWSVEGGQDDLKWYNGSKNADGSWSATADVRKHKTAGKYNVHVYATLSSGQMSFLGATSFNVSKSTVSEIKVQNYDNNTGEFQVVISGVQAPAGISKVQVPVWCWANQSDIKWYDAVEQGKGNYIVNVDPRNHKYHPGIYKIHVYVTAQNGVRDLPGSASQNVENTALHTIMGETQVTVDQMVRYYQSSKAAYPSSVFGGTGELGGHGGAATIEEFCQIYFEEAKAEGVRAEVAFAQAMHETNWLRYGGIVRVGQYNFGGLGALDGNATGNCASFKTVREGVRAQIQHLKAYASTDKLNNACVDPRFQYIKRGCAPYVEYLGKKENPEGLGWATAVNYGYIIVDRIKELKAM